MSQDFDENIKVVFQIYDFDKDNLISSEDIRTLLSHVPLSQLITPKKVEEVNTEGAYTKAGGGLYKLHIIISLYRNVYLDRIQSQEELTKLLGICMKDKAKINLEEFRDITENISCEMFLCVL